MIKTFVTPYNKGAYGDLFGASLYNTVDKLVRRMASKFYSILSDEDIEDLVHDGYLRVLENKDRVDFSKNFEGWVYRICKNLLNSYTKTKSRRNSWIVDLGEDFDEEDATFDLDRSSVMVDYTYVADRHIEEREFEERFWKAVNRLNPEQRKVAILVYEETPYKEMAKKLGCSENTLKTRVCRTRQALLKMWIAA